MRTLASQQRTYMAADAFEIDDIDYFEVNRKRVFFEDVLLVTYHRCFDKTMLVVTGVVTALFFGLALFSLGEGAEAAVAWMLVIFSVPFAIPLAIGLVFRLDKITIYGKRTKAQIAFALRKGRARRTYDTICRVVAEEQGRLADVNAAATTVSDSPKEPSEFPLPPAEP